jgi:hypothetical protein
MTLHPHPSLSRNTVEPTVKVTMTLKNNSAASHDYALVRYADIDATTPTAAISTTCSISGMIPRGGTTTASTSRTE